jgi:hypothetical protein
VKAEPIVTVSKGHWVPGSKCRWVWVASCIYSVRHDGLTTTVVNNGYARTKRRALADAQAWVESRG